MGRVKDGIRLEDGPIVKAPSYPGKTSRNNFKGSLLTKSEFISKAIGNWVRHFEDSDKYHNTGFGENISYLKRHLKYLFVSSNKIRRKNLWRWII